jgi:hypothetical protein
MCINTEVSSSTYLSRRNAANAGIVIAALAALSVGSEAAAAPTNSRDGGACTRTTEDTGKSCVAEAQADFWIAEGICQNKTDPARRQQCFDNAEADRGDAVKLCGDQFEARDDICDAVGEAPYAPVINPADFVDSIDNPYMPLVPGTIFTYRQENDQGIERVVITVTDETEKILGIDCRVVRDVATLNGQIIEDTLDFYTQDKHGNVWYFGEISQQFEHGDLTSLEGSWRAGVDGAKPGIIMQAHPHVGQTYRQEFSLGNAEDMAKVLSLTGHATVPAASCTNCLVTKEFTPIEPDASERKFYKSGVGFILGVESGDRLELIRIEHAGPHARE